MIGSFKRILRKYLNYGTQGFGGITKLWKSSTRTNTKVRIPTSIEYKGKVFRNIEFVRVKTFPEVFLVRINGLDSGYLYFQNKNLILDLYKKPPIKLGKLDEDFFKSPVERNNFMLKAIEIIEEG